MLTTKDKAIASSVSARLPEILTRAQGFPMQVNRNVLLLEPGPKFLAWHEQWVAGVKGLTDLPNSRAYLIPNDVSSVEELEAFLAVHGGLILESVVQGYMPRQRWPWSPDASEFPEWFQVKIVAPVEDICVNLLSKEPTMAALASGL